MRVATCGFLILACATAALCQTTSEVNGSVTDASGAAVPGAQVTVLDVDKGIERQVNSGEAGQYTAALLPPGNYRISVRKTGFKPVRRDGLRLEVNQTVRIDFALEVGDLSETVEITAAAPLVEAGTSALGQVVENKLINELPLNGRNFVQLAILGPGVTGVGTGAEGTIMSGSRPADLRPASEIFSNGNREGSNNFMIDGIDNNVRENFAITLRPSVEGVSEFKIQTNLFAAEQGRNPGATINVITKSGSNQWHGVAYEFLRNSSLDARNYFADPNSATPAFRQNQFGGNLGGPILRNKAFFFANYEGYRKSREVPSVNTVPTVAMRTGDFSAVRDIYDPFTVRKQAGTSSGYVRDPFPGRQIPQTRFDPVANRLMQAYPLPQTSALANNQLTNPKELQSWDQGDLRIDYNAGLRDMMFARFSRQDTTTIKPSTFAPVTIPGVSEPLALGDEASFAGDSVLKTYHTVASWNHTFSPSFLVETRMGYVRYDLDYNMAGVSPGARLGEKLGIPNANQGPRSDGVPIFSPSGYTGIGMARSLPIVRVENTFNPNTVFTRIKSMHTLKWGFELRRRQMSEFQDNRGSGRFNFSRLFTSDPNRAASTGDSAASFLLGTASAIEQDFLLVFGGIRGTETGSFFQDDWRVSDRLTLNLGIRYEYDTRFSEVANRWAQLDVFTGKMRIAGFNSDANVGVKPDRNNFAPRFGFAYRLREKTVIRGGFGIYYNTQGQGGVVLRLQRQLPFGPINVEDIDQFSASPRLVRDGFRPIPPLDFKGVAENPAGSFLAMTDTFKSGYTEQFNLQVQRQVGWDIVMKAGYVGNLSRQLHNTYNYNQQAPGPGTPLSRRPLGAIAPGVVNVDYAVTDGIGNYHAFNLTAEKRFASGLGFLTAYTWAHSIDNIGNDFGGAANGPSPQDIRYRGATERATSGFDVTQRLVHSMNYALPIGKGRKWDLGRPWANTAFGGWQGNAIFLSQVGLPFTPTLASPVSNAGASRPDRWAGGELPSRDPAMWFDTSLNTPGAAWGTPKQYTYGNSSRNPLRGPGRVNVDFSLFKTFPITEKTNLTFRSEFFNIMNTPQFGLPNMSIGSPAAGRITYLAGNMRQVQFALRLSF